MLGMELLFHVLGISLGYLDSRLPFQRYSALWFFFPTWLGMVIWTRAHRRDCWASQK